MEATDFPICFGTVGTVETSSSAAGGAAEDQTQKEEKVVKCEESTAKDDGGIDAERKEIVERQLASRLVSNMSPEERQKDCIAQLAEVSCPSPVLSVCNG